MGPSVYAAPWPVEVIPVIDSTNEEARRRAERGDFGPRWMRADVQTAGRGRLGRGWDSPSGNLFATALLELDVPLAEAARACFAAGLAVIDAAEAIGVETAQLKLKWPNDVLAGESKLAGILIETGSVGGRVFMAAGFGINLARAPHVPGRETARLQDMAGGAGISAEQMLTALDRTFRSRLLTLFSGDFESLRSNWLARAAHMGRLVEAGAADARVRGVMRGLDEDGSLVIQLADGALHRVRAGEVGLAGS